MNEIRKIPFSPPNITQAEIDSVVEVLKSGWITTGPKTKLLEQKIKDFCNCGGAACLSSQTTSAEMTLRILGVGEGDEVIVPSYTYTATASVVCHVGATPVIIDCAKDSFEMDYDKMEAAITEKTKAIIPVDIAGIICDYDRVYKAVENKKQLFRPTNEIQKSFGRIIVMADGAHSLGAVKNGKKAGEIADFTCFSFHAVKNLTTAEGGAAVWKKSDFIDNDALYKQYMLYSLHGQTKDALAKNNGSSWEYDIVDTNYKCNMPDVLAALGVSQLDRYEKIIERRHEIIAKYNDALKDYPVEVLNHADENHRSSGHLYFVRFTGKDAEYRNKFYSLMAENGVACNVHYKPLPMLTAYKKLGFDIADYPNAYDMHKNQLTLPLNTTLSDDDVDYVIEAFKKCFEQMK